MEPSEKRNKSAAEIERFYTSWKWAKCRRGFIESRGGLCERCLKRGIINAGEPGRPLEVHHKIALTVDNVNDPAVTLNWDNLELLCKDCHEACKPQKQRRWRFGPGEKLII